MELEIKEQSDKRLKLIIKGEDHTVCNILAKELWKDKSVKVSGYRIEHGYVDEPMMVIEANDPKKALLSAIDGIKKTNKELKSAFSSLK
jgi:DNA-directed RNA polymerase subunit L